MVILVTPRHLLFLSIFCIFLCSRQFTKDCRQAMEINPFIQPIIERLDSIESMLQVIQQDRISALENSPALSKIMSLTEFCQYAGLSRQTAYKLTSAQKVPHSKRGKRLYFDREKVDSWLLENQVTTRSEIQEKAKDYISKNQHRRRM